VTAPDLTLSVHREVLRWACKFAIAAPRDLADLATDADTNDLHVLAARTLSDPALAAEALRGLLEWMGLHIDTYVDVDGIGDTWRVVVYVPGEHVNEDVADVEHDRIAALFLALLAIPEDAPDRREQALAVLREAGR
jgi:hypothetical protein